MVMTNARSSPQFRALSRRLWALSLGVIGLSLTAFGLAVYQVVAQKLSQKLNSDLLTLANAAAHSFPEPTAERFKPRRSPQLQIPRKRTFDNDGDLDIPWQDLLESQQSLEWFDAEGKLLTQAGRKLTERPLVKQFQAVDDHGLRIITVPIGKLEKASIHPTSGHPLKQVQGYIRVSESTQTVNAELERLRWGLTWGGSLALLLSGLGSWWLMRQSLQPIEQSFRQLQQFTADASHELRHPLTSIKASAEVMLSHPERVHPADLQKLTAIAGAADEMASLVEDLLLLARSEDKLATTRIAIPLDELLEDLVDCFQPQATAKQLQLKHQLTPAWINADSTQIKRAFTNLLANALSYTASGSITLSSVLEDDWIVVQIVDTGIGIAPDDLPHIFDRFWRADQARSRREGGTGLGLAIAQTIVQSHRGKISVQSQLGVGSRFQVELPAL